MVRSGSVISKDGYGDAATPNLRNALAFDNKCSFEEMTSEGIQVLGVFSRSGMSNWSVAIGIPAAGLTAEVQSKLGWLALAIAILLASSFGLAILIGKG